MATVADVSDTGGHHYSMVNAALDGQQVVEDCAFAWAELLDTRKQGSGKAVVLPQGVSVNE